jgi:hypothetical protein
MPCVVVCNHQGQHTHDVKPILRGDLIMHMFWVICFGGSLKSSNTPYKRMLTCRQWHRSGRRHKQSESVSQGEAVSASPPTPPTHPPRLSLLESGEICSRVHNEASTHWQRCDLSYFCWALTPPDLTLPEGSATQQQGQGRTVHDSPSRYQLFHLPTHPPA